MLLSILIILLAVLYFAWSIYLAIVATNRGNWAWGVIFFFIAIIFTPLVVYLIYKGAGIL